MKRETWDNLARNWLLSPQGMARSPSKSRRDEIDNPQYTCTHVLLVSPSHARREIPIDPELEIRPPESLFNHAWMACRGLSEPTKYNNLGCNQPSTPPLWTKRVCLALAPGVWDADHMISQTKSREKSRPDEN